MASLDNSTGHEQDHPAPVPEPPAPRPRGEGAAEEEESANAQGDVGADPQNTTHTAACDPHEYQPPHPDADTEKDATDKEKKAIAVKYWCGNPNCEKELDPKKLKSCSGCKVIKYCSRECQTVSECFIRQSKLFDSLIRPSSIPLLRPSLPLPSTGALATAQEALQGACRRGGCAGQA